MSAHRKEVQRIIRSRADGNQTLIALAFQKIDYAMDGPPVAVAGVALRLARSELRKTPDMRPGHVPTFDVADSRVYDSPSDSQYAIKGPDIPELVLDRAFDDLEKSLWRLPDEAIADAIDDLGPLFEARAYGKPFPEASDFHRQVAARFVDSARKMVLRQLGSIGGTKQKRGMTKSAGIPTSGFASKPVVWADPGRGLTWVDEGTHYRQVAPWEAALEMVTVEQLPYRARTARFEQSYDRILDFKRPVRKSNSRKNKRSGRMGGSAVIR